MEDRLQIDVRSTERRLEDAHLAMSRGDRQAALDCLQALLHEDPTNRDAIQLLERIETDTIMDEAVRSANRCWYDDLIETRAQAWGLAAAGIALLILAVALAIQPVKIGLSEGFGSEHAFTGYTKLGCAFTYYRPVHNLLGFPTLVALAGGVALYVLWRNVRPE